MPAMQDLAAIFAVLAQNVRPNVVRTYNRRSTLLWGLYRSNFKVGDLARATAKSSRTPTGLLRLWARNMMNAITKNASTINRAFFAGSGPNAIVGLDTALDDSNLYAGVDRSLPENAGFRSTVIDPGQPTAPTVEGVR